ncbi:hypothetical protein [Rhodospirillaceae bacterium SYSU D60014]|uniref:hypothetical protein n=1 Tax=Virgifigura deserti TaxID=2268457 RepID=UPI000E675EE6
MIAVLISVFAVALIIGIPVSIAIGGADMAALRWGGSFSPMPMPQRLFSGIDRLPLMEAGPLREGLIKCRRM